MPEPAIVMLGEKKTDDSLEIPCELCGTLRWLSPDNVSAALAAARVGYELHFRCKDCMIKIHARHG